MTNIHRPRWRHVTWGLVLALGLGTASAAASRVDRHHPGKLSARAREEAGRKGTSRMDVLVRFRTAPGAAENNVVKGFGGNVRRQLHRSSRWMSVRMPAHMVANLANNPNVEFVASDAPVAAVMDVARQAAGQPQPIEPESMFKGAGITIAQVDSGVAQHPEIQTLVAAVDFVAHPDGGDPDPLNSIDPDGHGTHVAGILVGTGANTPEGRLAGVAPEASLVSVRVLDDQGHGSTSDVLAGLQWVLAHKDQYGIRVLNLSLGHQVYEPASVDPLVEAVDALWDAGVVVVCSAGNGGRSGDATVTSPCNSRKVITVGALNDRRTADTQDDNIATYSSRGPTLFDMVAKPDIVAPGNRIVSARAAGSYLDTLFPERRVAGNPDQPEVQEYYEASGTSMASPIVAGAAALMLQADGSLNPATVKARLMRSARKTSVGAPFATGAGALDILGALRASGSVADALSPLVTQDAAGGTFAVENTSVLWGNEEFSLATLWPDAVLWPDPPLPTEPMLSSNGVLWPSGSLPDYTPLWPPSVPDAQAVLWPDTSVWDEAVLWPDGEVPIEPLAIGTQDPN